MQQSKLVKAIKLLDSWELRHFKDFIYSPFFNKNEKVTTLIDLLLAHYPDFKHPELDREKVNKKLFPGQEFHEQRYKDILSLATKTFRNFLAFYELRTNGFRKGIALLDAYRERNLDREFEKQLTGMRKDLAKNDEKLQSIFLKDLELQESIITFETGRMSRSLVDSISSAAGKLDSFFLISRLKYGVEMANRKNVVGQEFDLGLLQMVLDYLSQNPGFSEEQPAIRIYHLIYICITQNDSEPAFSELFQTLKTHGDKFPRQERRQMFSYTNNICIKHINQGKPEYLSLLIELYKLALGNNSLLSMDGWLLQWDYKNIVSASLKAGEVEWCQQFIENSKDKIAPEFRENAYTYNLASFHFEQKDYGRALTLLQEVEFSDVFYALGSRVILMKSYYEMVDYDALVSLCAAFKIYLKRTKSLSKYQFSIYFNLVLFTKKTADLRKKLSLMRKESRKAKINFLREKIIEKGNIAQIKWLKTKLKELE